jgi:hypothetical protein
MATAFGVRRFGAALVVILDYTDFGDEGTSGSLSNHFRDIRDDYQSGTKLPHSKGFADDNIK